MVVLVTSASASVVLPPAAGSADWRGGWGCQEPVLKLPRLHFETGAGECGFPRLTASRSE